MEVGEKGPAFTTSKAKRKKRRGIRWTPRVVVTVQARERPDRPPKWRPTLNYIAGPYGPALNVGEVFGRFAHSRLNGGGLTYWAKP